MNFDQSTTHYDDEFKAVQDKGLTWLPWVGQRYLERPLTKRLLIIGESHYCNRETPEQRQVECKEYLDNCKSTRDQTSQVLVNCEWKNKTLNTIPKLLFKTTEIDRSRLWADSAYYNFIQRPMVNKNERPTPEDFIKGWRIFADIAKILQPSNCLFIGVAAANSFNLGSISCTRQVGRTWARTAKLQEAGTPTELIFVKHLGKYFSWIKWHGYLQTQHADLMDWLKAESYTNIHNHSPQ